MIRKYCRKITLILSVCITIFSGCTSVDLFEKNLNIPDIKWKSDFVATGQFAIVDTTAFYKVYIVMRHTDAYQYNNIWLNVGLQAVGDSAIMQKINLQLGTDALGWEGAGMNDIWEVRKLITRIPLKKTSYNFSISPITTCYECWASYRKGNLSFF
jgi:gliding motility-associated lipoprotein GldH